MCADQKLQNNLNLRFHLRRSRFESDDYLKVKRDQRFRLARQILHGAQLNRFVNTPMTISGEPKDLVTVPCQFPISLMVLSQGC